MNINEYLKRIKAIGGGLIVELEAMENKIEIMKNKGQMRRVNIWIEDDLTNREKQVQEWLDSIVREEGINGLETWLGYRRLTWMEARVERNR